MAAAPWAEETIRSLNDPVLVRSVRRFRAALRQVDGHTSAYVRRMQHGLRIMEKEMHRRNLEGAAPHGTTSVSNASGERARSDDGKRSGSGNASGDEAQGGQRTSPNGEPVWRLIPHVGSRPSKLTSVITGDGIIRHQRGPVEPLLGIAAGALVGHPLADILDDSCKEKAREAVARMVRGEEKFDCWRLQLRAVSGETTWMEGLASNFLRDPRLGGILVHWRTLAG